MSQTPAKFDPILRYKGRITIDWRGIVTLLDRPQWRVLNDPLSTGTYEATIEIGKCLSLDGRVSSHDLRKTRAFHLLRRTIIRDDDAAEGWLRTPARSLRGAIPADLLQTPAGKEAVEEAILGIAHGNFM